VNVIVIDKVNGLVIFSNNRHDAEPFVASVYAIVAITTQIYHLLALRLLHNALVMGALVMVVIFAILALRPVNVIDILAVRLLHNALVMGALVMVVIFAILALRLVNVIDILALRLLHLVVIVNVVLIIALRLLHLVFIIIIYIVALKVIVVVVGLAWQQIVAYVNVGSMDNGRTFFRITNS
jgi:hypothetical protein